MASPEPERSRPEGDFTGRSRSPSPEPESVAGARVDWQQDASEAEGATQEDNAGSASVCGGVSGGAAPGNELSPVEQAFKHARLQNFPALLKMLEELPHLWEESDADGYTLLHWAALVGHVAFAAVAVKEISPDAEAHNKQTPLMWAALRGHIALVRLLVGAGANLRAKDSLGATPLLIAVQHRQMSAALLLLHHGTKILLEDRDNHQCAAVHWAAYKGHLEILKLFEYFQADLHALDNIKMTPLHRAVTASQTGVIDFLVECKADVTQRNADHKSCLDIAQHNQDEGMLYSLRRAQKKAEKAKREKASSERELSNMEEGRGGNSVAVEEEGPGTGDAASSESSRDIKARFIRALQDPSAQKAFPIFWLVCVSLSVFEYLVELRPLAYAASPTAALLWELGVPVSLAIFSRVALMDPGKVPTPVRGNSGVEKIMKALAGEAPAGVQAPNLSRLCMTTWLLKDYRTKYCTQTKACVEEFDHYCIWLNCTIARGNHRQFVLLGVAECFTQCCFLYCLWYLSLFEYKSLWNFVTTFTLGYPLLLLLAFVHVMTAPWVLMLVLHQMRLISANLTTNEMMNMHRYPHFWEVIASSGYDYKRFRNPFDKGGCLKNQIDFWWACRRSEFGPAVLKQAQDLEGLHHDGLPRH